MTTAWTKHLLQGGVVLSLIGIVSVGCLHGSHATYRRFVGQALPYYDQFGQACDSLLAHHSLAGGAMVHVPVTEAALPEIVRGLRPSGVELQTNYVRVTVGEPQTGFAITWQQIVQSNRVAFWALTAYSQQLGRTNEVYGKFKL